MLRRLYDWTMALASGRGAEPTLAAVSFAESSFFPIPPDLLLIPMVLAERARAWRYAAIATVTGSRAAAISSMSGFASSHKGSVAPRGKARSKLTAYTWPSPVGSESRFWKLMVRP